MAKKTKPRKKQKEASVDAPFDREQFNELLKTALAHNPKKKQPKK